MKKIAFILLIVSSIFGSALVVAGEFQRVQLRGETGSQSTAEISDVIFGPVSTNDTLWRIARDYRNSSEFAADRPASLYPVMYGIYVLNPKAFKDNNVNQLLDNAMLELPSPNFVAAINLDMARTKIEGDEDAVGYIDPTESPTESPSDNSNKNSTVVSTPKAKSTSVALNPVTLTSNELQILNELKNQYAVSLETIQVLLDENELLSEQLQQVSQQLTSLSNRVDGDVQEQLDAQAELQAQLYALLQKANLRNKPESQSTFFSDIKALLKEPMVMIALLSGIVLAALIALGMWLFARTPKLSDVVPEEPVNGVVDAAPDIIELSEADLEVPADSLFTNTDTTAVDELITDDLLSEESSDELAQSALDELFGSGDLETASERVDDGDALVEAIDVSNDIDELNAEMDMQDALTEDVLEELLNDADLSAINDVISPANDTLSAEPEPEPEPEPMSKMAVSLLDDLPDIGGWMLHENDESDLDDLENTD
ncbi:MAG: FimV/HubP family polar landmark protein, partial [Glaciecola sp.]|nr:FimV/HubP family polar landmark protein [Glaciecola sp.]